MTRRLAIIVFTAMLLITGACSSDDNGGDSSDQATAATAADSGGDTDAPASDGNTGDGDTGGGNTSGPSGRLEIGDEDYNFYLGDMTTAMCQVKGNDDVMIQDMRASDDSWVAASVMGSNWVVTFRGPDGNRKWVTGNTEEAEGLDVSFDVFDNVFSVKGTWVDPDDAGNTEEGRLVITC